MPEPSACCAYPWITVPGVLTGLSVPSLFLHTTPGLMPDGPILLLLAPHHERNPFDCTRSCRRLVCACATRLPSQSFAAILPKYGLFSFCVVSANHAGMPPCEKLPARKAAGSGE